MEMIFQGRPKNIDDLIAILNDHPLQDIAKKYKASYDYARIFPVLSSSLKPHLPYQKEDLDLWTEGLLTVKSGMHPHPLILDEDELTKIIAFSQREVFLPLVDHVHHLISWTIEKAFGQGIWEHLEPNADLRNEVLAEISPLAFFLKNKVKKTGFFNSYARNITIELAFKWRDIRHTVSHNNMLSYVSLKNAFNLYSDFVDKVYSLVH
jgi:hypothetical protein